MFESLIPNGTNYDNELFLRLKGCFVLRKWGKIEVVCGPMARSVPPPGPRPLDCGQFLLQLVEYKPVFVYSTGVVRKWSMFSKSILILAKVLTIVPIVTVLIMCSSNPPKVFFRFRSFLFFSYGGLIYSLWNGQQNYIVPLKFQLYSTLDIASPNQLRLNYNNLTNA